MSISGYCQSSKADSIQVALNDLRYTNYIFERTLGLLDISAKQSEIIQRQQNIIGNKDQVISYTQAKYEECNKLNKVILSEISDISFWEKVYLFIKQNIIYAGVFALGYVAGSL